ncbi:DUF397 domain-containing protein [Streptomyces sp. NPDC058171]
MTEWVKSTYSSGSPNCVEVRRSSGDVAMRDSKWLGAGPHVTVTRDGWRHFVAGLQSTDLLS